MGESKSDVLQGTLDLMVLKTLESMGPLHGYGIARRIEQVSGNALTLNQAVTFTATLGIAQSTASPAGLTVTFKDGTTVLGTAVLNAAGTATFKTSALPAGTDHVTVSYAGSANLMASTSPVLTETVASSTKTVVKSSLVPAAVDQVHAQSGHG